MSPSMEKDMTSRRMSPGEYRAELEARMASARAARADHTHAGHPATAHQRRRWHKTSIVIAVGALLVGAISVFADGGNLDVQVDNSTQYAVDTTTDGAIVEYIGKDNNDFGSSGTGVINSFLQTQDNPSEEGYNTNGTTEFDTGSSPQFNRAILVSEIPTVACESLDGTETAPGLCWELFSDINDSNANDPDASHIQLTDLEIWLTDDENITGFDQGGGGFGSDADQVYDFSGTVLINDVNSGSGRGDLRYLVPLSAIDLSTLAPDCGYGSSDCNTYFVVYTEWGDTEGGDFISDSGFEEWTVKRYPFLDVTKTATPTFTRTFNWTIDKSVDPDSWSLFDGDSGTSDYTIAVTKDDGTDSDWAVTGTISIDNPSNQDAVIASVTDVLSVGGAATVDCAVTFPYTLADGDTLECTYSKTLGAGTDQTNTATVMLDSGAAFTGDADVDFGDPTTTVRDTIHVVDNNLALPGEPVAFSDDGSVPVSKTFDCTGVTYTDGHGSYTFNNTASIQETGQESSASVDVDCYKLDVTKTADASRDRKYTWTIDKSADQSTLTMMPGEAAITVNYSVTVDVSGSTDSNFDASGDIVISDPNPDRDADLTEVTDVVFDGIDADVTCPSLTVPKGGTLTCSWTAADLPDDSTRLNTATATQQNYDFASDLTPTESDTTDYSGTANVDFSGAATNEIDECIDVTDTYQGALGTVCVTDTLPKTFTYSRDIGPFTEEDCGEVKIDNTASFVTNDTDATGESSWEVVVTIPCPLGCTLTQGYWKTHNDSFKGGAPSDPNWSLIGDFDGDGTAEAEGEAFFDTGQTWFQVFWSSVSGRPYYQLAHQWMAAYLNTLSIEAIGGTIPANVQDALDDGQAFLDANDGNKDLKGKNAKSLKAEAVELAGILGAFNEGTIGPGHCDEPIVVVSGQTISGAPFLLLPLGLLAPAVKGLRRRARQ